MANSESFSAMDAEIMLNLAFQKQAREKKTPESQGRDFAAALAEGEAIIARQRALIEKLARDGHPTEEAEEFLRKFMKTQAENVAYWELLSGQVESKSPRAEGVSTSQHSTSTA
ncbi:hypothetical protein [Mesorhizobium sp.]|uniref:hypothetical protein n=1 Tax=Mesorhizobium sp. TaxID=1871066 RepID=UPI000FE6BE8C|nr:hypothetical protein [Mesorhizobium sp.]RWF64944.1 MAG: hypothetical protein EOS47_12665 [Mesorhizobium sp.]TIT43612.1 MAG: hypothetical protein E5W76_06010 [Mesorhizobium sp.]